MRQQMERIDNHPGLASGEGWHEIAFATGDADFPTARVRVTPQTPEQAERLHQPNAAPVPVRVEAILSASLIDAAGDVLRVGGKLLLGPESVHSYQFDADAPFDPAAWIDGCAALVVGELLKQARGISAAAAAGLIVDEPEPEPEPIAPPFVVNPAWITAPQGEA
jgi:hypothetical protein